MSALRLAPAVSALQLLQSEILSLSLSLSLSSPLNVYQLCDTFRHHLKTRYFQQAFKLTYSAFLSDSASADRCTCLLIIFYLITYLLLFVARQ